MPPGVGLCASAGHAQHKQMAVRIRLDTSFPPFRDLPFTAHDVADPADPPRVILKIYLHENEKD